MKKSIVFLFTFLIAQLFAQRSCDIQNHYQEFISIKKNSYNEKEYLSKTIHATKTKFCFSDLVNNNIQFVDYLLVNFFKHQNYQNHLKLTDSIALQKAFIEDLKKDTLFNALMKEWVSKTLDKTKLKDTITMKNMLNSAVKFFSVNKIKDGKYYVGKVCVGINDITKTEPERKPFLEAFCFQTIFSHYETEFNLHEEFKKCMKELYTINLGVDENERLLRAQGAMYMLMKNNQNLKDALKTEYEKNKEYLPFVLKD